MKKWILPLAAILILGAGAAAADESKAITLSRLASFNHGNEFDAGQAEIVAYDAGSKRVFVINAADGTVDILDVSNPKTPVKTGQINVTDNLVSEDVGGVNSVAVHKGLVAVAVENGNQQADGWAAFYDAYGNFKTYVKVGALPDAITFTKNGKYVLVANEGQPNGDYTVDPEGSVSVIDVRNGVLSAVVKTAGFTAFNGVPPAGVRISGPVGTTVAQDLEPEYIATSKDSKTAWVTLQETHALAIVDIRTATVTKLVGLGLKDHSRWRNSLDASDRDDMINIKRWPVFGTYMPDSIASYERHGRTYLVTANEGDSREYTYDADESTCEAAGHIYDGDNTCISYIDEVRVKDVKLDETVFPDAATLQMDENIGRLKMLATEGANAEKDSEGNLVYHRIQSFGARSITIWDAKGRLVSDSGNTIERKTAKLFPEYFNSNNDENDSFDSRSDDKGPEPEGVVVGKVHDRYYAFVGLERIGGIMIFDVTNPRKMRYVDYVNNRNFDPTIDVEEEITLGNDIGDFGPEGLAFIGSKDSPNGKPLLVVGNEISGTTTIYQITPVKRRKHDHDDDDDDDYGERKNHERDDDDDD